jgi:glycosyltransferase involved in cell wall biosynthesis
VTKLILSANTDWYIYNYRLSLAQAILDQGYELLLLTPSGRYGEKLRNLGFQLETIRLNRHGLNPFADSLTLLQILGIYRREQPDLVHHFTIKPMLYGSLAARAAGISLVANSVTGLGRLFVNPSRLEVIFRLLALPLLRLALNNRRGLTIFQNERDATVFQNWKLTEPGRYLVIPSSGVDVDRFTPSPEPKGDAVVLLAARMLWDKGVGELVEAARLLRQRGIPGRVVLAGDVDLGNPVSIEKNQLVRWQKEGVVEWLGHVDNMPEILAKSHIFVLPTTYGEGVSMSLIEAAAAGRPIVASDMPGCREVVDDGRNGFLVPPKNPNALADAIEQLLLDPKLRARMGQAGREIALERFSDKLINAETLQAYSSLLQAQGIPAPI